MALGLTFSPASAPAAPRATGKPGFLARVLASIVEARRQEAARIVRRDAPLYDAR
jgi:hypothetical protein